MHEYVYVGFTRRIQLRLDDSLGRVAAYTGRHGLLWVHMTVCVSTRLTCIRVPDVSSSGSNLVISSSRIRVVLVVCGSSRRTSTPASILVQRLSVDPQLLAFVVELDA